MNVQPCPRGNPFCAGHNRWVECRVGSWGAHQPDLFTVAHARARDPVTSKDAARRVTRRAQAQADMILAALRQLGPRGATYKELDDRFGWPHPTAARRLAAIVQAGDAMHFDGRDGRPLVKRDGCAIYVATGWAVMAAHRAGKGAA